MNRNEIRHELIAALLQADGPVAVADLFARCGVTKRSAGAVLTELVEGGQVVRGRLVDGSAEEMVRWAARWEEETKGRSAESLRTLRDIVDPADVVPASKLAIDSPAVLSFHDYIINTYTPPADKRMLVFLQCSVRRPFSSSPSHGSMRRAIRVATGFGPAKEFESCPVHVVVLASRIGPVPYELEDVYPANAGGGGVKHFRDEHYGRVRPILAQRMAEYITTHRDSYDHIATFTDGRYGEVMADAREIAGEDFPVYPDYDGPKIHRMGKSKPRTYWQKRWIQLYLEIVSWLPRSARVAAEQRLKKLKVKYG